MATLLSIMTVLFFLIMLSSFGTTVLAEEFMPDVAEQAHKAMRTFRIMGRITLILALASGLAWWQCLQMQSNL